ncbi:hypothetical protein KBTX_00047 [wastewater metagenome]|uniref:Flagellar hook-length control protein-like C-terminal domain-containing protein n=2 Tax=unclassified sequences TaxID=12908 RepID=A0A5B8RAR0_9ZZZZ|nr:MULTISPECIES: flagellar hook-length control protein FliK [Arhodomonas]MCS4502770.1 flagellar hook-length control protein FliK [Arhodomonas aquaeolei]QEA03747.1 hypothetical protein KBTEX_00047 [uncultured organism]
MLYTPPANPRPVNVPTEARPLLQVLPAGRVLHATVRRGDEGQMMAVAGRLRLPLPAGTGLSPGDTVALRVTAGEGGRTGIELLPGQGGGADALTRLQRTNVPRQQPVTQGIRLLAGLQAQDLPEPAARALQPLLASLPSPRQLSSAEGLHAALRDSGTLFESRITARPELAGSIARNDLRANLLRLAAALRGNERPDGDGLPNTGTPPGRATQDADQAVTGALARQMLHQLAAHRPDGQVTLGFELPVANGGEIDDLRLSIREESSGRGDDSDTPKEDAGKRWRVDVRLGFAGLGELEARLFYDADGLSITWRAEDAVLREALATEMPRLEEALGDAGLAIQGLTVSERPPEPEMTQIPGGGEGLIDDRA